MNVYCKGSKYDALEDSDINRWLLAGYRWSPRESPGLANPPDIDGMVSGCRRQLSYVSNADQADMIGWIWGCL
jgi:hypothetical protein